MKDLEKKLFIEKYVLGYVKRVKYLIQKFKEDGIKEKEIRNDISKLAELSSLAWNEYINNAIYYEYGMGMNLLDFSSLTAFSTSLAYLEATLDFLEILKDSKRKRATKGN